MPKAQIQFDSLVKQTNHIRADVRHPPYLIKIVDGTLLWQTHQTTIEILIGVAIGRASSTLEFFKGIYSSTSNAKKNRS